MLFILSFLCFFLFNLVVMHKKKVVVIVILTLNIATEKKKF